MKRLLSVLLIASILVSLSGCNNAPSDNSSALGTTSGTTAPQTTTEPVVDATSSVIEQKPEETTTTETMVAPETTTSATVPETTTTVAPETTTTTAPETTTTTAPETTATIPETTTVAKEEAPLPEMIYEAENGKLNGTLKISSGNEFSGGKAVENFGGKTDYLCIDVDIPANGMYDITFVSSGIGSYKENNLIIDNTPIGVFKSEQNVLTENTIPSVNLTKGSHEIKITPSWGWIKLDYIKVIKAEGIKNEIYDVSNTLINKNANADAKALFNFLSDSYGKYVLSGQVCDDGYNGKEFTAIRKVTGKTPAILGLDFMDYTPSRTALGARSHAVDKAIEFGNMGGIVTFCWHWNAPTEYLKDGNDSDNGNPRWWGGFYTRNSTFDIAKVMNGTDKTGKELIDRDIKEIAKQLKRLEEAGVPVLWRPLHEASGGWFWWGAKGSDAYKKLWIYLYEELTNKYECNNLIWVFNGQNDEWYPGDEYVDIVGEDIYPGERVYAPQTAKFKEAAGYSDSNKIVALTENGCIFDIDQAVATNTMWAWFCTWGGEFASYGTEYSEKYTEKSIIKKAYDSKYVLTLDELPEIYD